MQAVLPVMTYGPEFSSHSRVAFGMVCTSGNSVPDGMAESQSQFLQLRLVCRKFNSVFKSHHRLSRGQLLSPTFTHKSLPSLPASLRQCGASVQTFAAYCGSPCTEAALKGLMLPQTSLANVYLSECSSSAVQLMSQLFDQL